MPTITCPVCGEQDDVHPTSRLKFCNDCRGRHISEGARAMSRVGMAVRRGDMRPARECDCTDCGNPASQYDHRDYLQPLVVEPVCAGCNARRGPAFDSRYRPLAA